MASKRQQPLQSMTGYGRATRQTALGSVVVEVRSTNHRYLEIEQRLPNGCTALQAELAQLLRRHIQRGRVELTVAARSEESNAKRVAVDEALLQQYHEVLVGLKRRFGLKGRVRLEHLLALPQALRISEERVPGSQLWEFIRRAAKKAVQELVRARRREGAKLVADLRGQFHAIERHVRLIKATQPKALEQQRQHLRVRLRALLGGTSSASQLEEVVALVKEADVHEELVRLESHLEHLCQTLAGRLLVGKRLDFIAQELMREANTLGAKVNDAQATRHVVEMKGCIEKIREQAQNLE